MDGPTALIDDMYKQHEVRAVKVYAKLIHKIIDGPNPEMNL